MQNTTGVGFPVSRKSFAFHFGNNDSENPMTYLHLFLICNNGTKVKPFIKIH